MNTAPLSLYFKYNRGKYNGNDKKFIVLSLFKRFLTNYKLFIIFGVLK